MSHGIRLPLLLALAASLFLLSGCGLYRHPAPDLKPASSGSELQGLGGAIAKTAMSQVGKSYVSGAASPSKGFDCSGLVQWACAANGVSVPRRSADQASAGRAVGRTGLRPGDILVFRIPRSGYHTGIYTGGGRFVHSPKPGAKVRMENLSLDYWVRTYIAARRVTGVR
ncbi:MAG: C40 family peptidase [Mailhella sp.]|nr:C40 family peptidase [Mailhella sp.]